MNRTMGFGGPKEPVSNPPPLALRPPAAAKALGLSERTLWELTAKKAIPHVRIGKCVLYPVNLLEEWLAGQAEGGQR